MSDVDPASSRSPNDETGDLQRRDPPPAEVQSCDMCGGTDLIWLRCKLVCNQCHTIVMTCGDL